MLQIASCSELGGSASFKHLLAKQQPQHAQRTQAGQHIIPRETCNGEAPARPRQASEARAAERAWRQRAAAAEAALGQLQADMQDVAADMRRQTEVRRAAVQRVRQAPACLTQVLYTSKAQQLINHEPRAC